MKKTIICFIIVILTLFNAKPLYSKSVSDKTIDEQIIEEMKWLQEEAFDAEVVTASKKAQKISDAPATIISISKEQIEVYGWRDLKDIFRALPGIDVSYNVQGELKTLVIMRGVSGNQKILILQDGQRYSPASGERFLYGNNLPLNIYKRIEIIYGPASCLYGADAYAGVINLITKDGADYDGLEVNVGYLSTGAYSTDFSFGKKVNDDTDVILSARIFRGEDEKLHEDYEEYSGVNTYQGNLNAYENDYPIKDWNLFFKLRYHRFIIGFDWQHELESNAAVSRPETYAYIGDSLWGQDLRHFYIENESYSNKNLNIKTTFSAGDYEVNTASNYFLVQKDEAGNLTNGIPAYKYAYSSYLKGNIQANWDINEKFSTMWGFSYEKVTSFPKTRNLSEPFDTSGNRQVDMSDFTDSNGYTFGILGFSEPVFTDRDFNNVGLFVQTEYNFSDRIKLDGGIRYDYNSVYKETLNPRLGLIVDPLENLTVKLLYGTAYIQPSNFYKYENFANQFILQIPNEDLEPEKLENYSLDISYILGKTLSLHGALFLNKMDDIIRPVQATEQENNYPYYNPYRNDQGYVQYNRNQGEIESRGGEIALKYKIERFLTDLSYSYLTGEDNGFDIPQISEHKITLNSSYMGEKWSGGMTLRYYADVSTDRNNYRYGSAAKGGDESYSFDGAFVAYINLIYRLNKHLSGNLSIDNIFDTKHYGGVPFDGSPVVVPRTPQPLRKIYAGLKYSF